MMFTPNYTVSYRGEFYAAGERFQIDPKDADEMSKHGTVEPVGPKSSMMSAEPSEPLMVDDRDMLADQETAKRQPGRQRRA